MEQRCSVCGKWTLFVGDIDPGSMCDCWQKRRSIPAQQFAQYVSTPDYSDVLERIATALENVVIELGVISRRR